MQYVVTLGGDGLTKFRKLNIHVELIQINRNSFWGTIKILLELYSFCKKNRIDIIHSHHRYFDLLATIISKPLNLRTIMSVQSKVKGFSFLSYNSDILIAVSATILNHLQHEYKISPSRIVLINNFVDVSEIRCTKTSSQLRTELNISNQNIIGFIARNSIREKGVDIMLNAFRRVESEFHDVLLIMVGKGADDEYVKRVVQKYGLNVLVLGPKEDIYNYYNICDLIILPSRVEPFSVSLLEAGFMKKAVVASNVDGIPELIENGKEGLLFPVNGIEQLSANIKLLLGNKDLCQRLGNNLHRKVLADFTSERIIPQYKSLYSNFEWKN